jgi:hypothetical protein
MTAGVLLTRHGSQASSQAVSAPAKTPSGTAVVATAPPMPEGVLDPPVVTAVHGGGVTMPCTVRHGPVTADPGQGWPSTLRALYQESAVVVVARATDSRGYWRMDDGRLPAPNIGHMDWASLTATNFSVERVVKGTAGRWLQVIDAGADAASIPTCPLRAEEFEGWPAPRAGGQEYVVFLQWDALRGRLREQFGPLDRWPIINGTVHPDRDLQPDAWSMAGVAPAPLEAFLANAR